MPNKSLDIVLPCYNPIENWVSHILESSRSLYEKYQLDHKIILVNDGSTKGIQAEDIESLRRDLPNFEYVDLPINQGKGVALRSGIAVSKAEICLFTDVDFPYTLDSLKKIFDALNSEETDIAIGIKDAGYYEFLPPLRVKVSQFLRWLARTFLRISITDTQCGLKGFNGAGRDIFLQTSIARYLADLEFIFLADREKSIKMKSYTVSLREGVEFSRVNLKILLVEGGNFLKVFLRALWKS